MTDARVVNLTPHALRLVGQADREVVVAPAGEPARCDMERTVIEVVEVGGLPVPLVESVAGPITGLPEPEPGTIYVTSRVVAEVAAREDVRYPDDLVRDEHGNVVGCRSLGRTRPVPERPKEACP